MRVTPTGDFLKAVKKLPPDRQKKVAATLKKFMMEPRPPSLNYRHLRGAEGYRVIDSTSGDRIILRQISDDEFEAVDAGTHDIYRRWDR